MKSKFFIPGLLISIALLTVSCTNDDYEVQTNSGTQSKTFTKDQLQQLNVNATAGDSINHTNTTPQTDNPVEGDPINPRPPRK